MDSGGFRGFFNYCQLCCICLIIFYNYEVYLFALCVGSMLMKVVIFLKNIGSKRVLLS